MNLSMSEWTKLYDRYSESIERFIEKEAENHLNGFIEVMEVLFTSPGKIKVRLYQKCDETAVCEALKAKPIVLPTNRLFMYTGPKYPEYSYKSAETRLTGHGCGVAASEAVFECIISYDPEGDFSKLLATNSNQQLAVSAINSGNGGFGDE